MSNELKAIQHLDRDGNPISLYKLIINEPEWAVSRITQLEKLELSRPTEPKEEEPKTKIAEEDSMLLFAEGQLLGYYLSSCGTSIGEVVGSMGLERGEWEKLSGRVNLKDADREEIEEYFLAICDEVRDEK